MKRSRNDASTEEPEDHRRERVARADIAELQQHVAENAENVDAWLEMAKNYIAIGSFEAAYDTYMRHVARTYWERVVSDKLAADTRIADMAGVGLNNENHQDVRFQEDERILMRAVNMARFIETSAQNAVRANHIDFAAFAQAIDALPTLAQTHAARAGIETFVEFEMMREDHDELAIDPNAETTDADN